MNERRMIGSVWFTVERVSDEYTRWVSDDPYWMLRVCEEAVARDAATIRATMCHCGRDFDNVDALAQHQRDKHK